jgi:diguanylate cyclase (GGDEF)-like protein
MIHRHDSVQGERIVELVASPLFNSTGELYAIIEVARDITERLKTEELLNANEKRLHHLAHHDALTDLPNRLLFEDRLKQALSKARRSHRQVALFFLDLDQLKKVNDNLGHNHGDLLLIDIAQRLRKCVREGDTVARMGGDEFLVLLEDIESIEMIETMAKRICTALEHDLIEDNFTQKISVSIGISIFPEDATSGSEMMKNADLAMYRVKRSGKANYQFYSTPQGRFLFE